jgi:hypothetical protein
MDTIKIDFVDFWPDLHKTDNYFYHLLCQKYQPVIDCDDPDIVFMSCYDTQKHKYQTHRCKKIFFSGENRGAQCVVNGKWAPFPFPYDILLTSDETAGKNVFLPLFVLYMNWFNCPDCHERDISFLTDIEQLKAPLASDDLLLRKVNGCCFLAKNPTARERVQFCNQVKKHIHVDCPGPVLNNCEPIGGRGDQVQKIDFLRKYRLNIAFENSQHNGYITEKILHGLYTGAVPVYWGSSEASKFFNEKNFIHVGGRSDWDAAISKMKQIINNDQAYLDMVSQPAILQSTLDRFDPELVLSMII